MLLVPLHHGQCVARAVLVRDVPRLRRTATRAADRKPGALPEGVERQAAVLPEHTAIERFDRPGCAWQIAAQKSANGRSPMKQIPVLSGLSCTGKPGGARQFAHLLLGQLAQREQYPSVALARDRMQKVGLILGIIARLVEPWSVRKLHQACIVAGRKQRAHRAAVRSPGTGRI